MRQQSVGSLYSFTDHVKVFENFQTEFTIRVYFNKYQFKFHNLKERAVYKPFFSLIIKGQYFI